MKFTYATSARPVDGYTIQRGIHRGGFGEVYYALSDAGKEVALKLLTHDSDTELRGIRQCLNLKHPNLVTIFDVRTDGDGDQWVIMEYVQGASLDDVLAAFPQGLPVSEVRDWLHGICAGAEYLHDRGIVHRDLKPANVYRENGVVKIGDVGLSKRMGGDRRGQHTESVGTVYYMAPEVAQGKYGPEVDVYSLGVMAYEMLTGRLPFDGETAGEILMKHLTAAPDLQPLPEALRPVVARALQKDPQKRTASVRKFADEFQRALSGVTTLPESAFLPPPLNSDTRQQAASRIPFSFFPPEPPQLKRDTDRTHQTSRANGAPLPPPVSSTPSKRSVRAVESLHRTRKASKHNDSSAVQWHRWLPWAAIACILFIPWSQMSWGDIRETGGIIGFWGGLLYALAWWCRPADQRLWVNHTSSGAGLPLDSLSRTSFAEQLSSSLLLGAMLSASLSYAGLLALGWFEPPWLNGLSPSSTALIVGVAVLGSSGLLALSQSRQLTGRELSHPNLSAAGLGAAVGAAACGLDGFLLAQFPNLGDSSESAFGHLGAHPLWLDHQPTIVAYMVFFAATFWLQKWPALLDPYRTERLQLSALAKAAFCGWLVSMFFGVPRPYAMVWAVAITTAAQLAAPWQPGGNVRKVDVKTA